MTEVNVMQHKQNELSKLQTLKQESADTVLFSIGETAQMIDSTVKTVRYYDEIQLVKAPFVNNRGYRFYTTEAIWRLQLVKTLRELRFGIDDIKRLLSGEISMETSLDWQIETLQTEVQALNGMIAILNNARSIVNDYSKDSKTNPSPFLSHIHELVHIQKQNQQNRQQFVLTKIEEIGFMSDIPAEWQDAFFHYFNKYILHPEDLSAKQLMAWKELKELISSPEFIADLQSVEFLFVNIAQHPIYETKEWLRLMQSIQKRLSTALRNNYEPHSSYVQAVVDDAIQLYSDSNAASNSQEILQMIEDHIDKLETQNFKRSVRLCSILSPEFEQLSQRDNLLFQGLRWKLQQI
ncbi:MerR family transcriptional regulator [Paenibacillus silvae]|uniref:MerR family transcriptional regulator n=1 Tax=Paenibacillus silvae TaxID=1325358 RepID=A0ABQ1Z8G7_9BACL|nr:MerR family transcriptional regulator [Paenibacillus silvae]GGH50916.1 MerR family transcriptional regulator [Paenibacillus silvae]